MRACGIPRFGPQARGTEHPWRRAKLRQVAPIPHDLRRSAARDWRPYMSEGEIMNLCGWRSRATFERDDIQDPKDVAAGIQRRDGTIAAQSDAPAPSEE